MLNKIYKNDNKFGGIGDNFSLKLPFFLISIDKLICQKIHIFKAPLLCYQIMLRRIIMQIMTTIPHLTNFVLTYNHFLKAQVATL